MSRGLGRVQREVLRAVRDLPMPEYGPWDSHRYWRLDDIGPHVFPDWSNTPAQRRSLQRAVASLWKAGLVDTGTVAGGREHRVCVTPVVEAMT